jgi:hypothetical protein
MLDLREPVEEQRAQGHRLVVDGSPIGRPSSEFQTKEDVFNAGSIEPRFKRRAAEMTEAGCWSRSNVGEGIDARRRQQLHELSPIVI